MYLTITILVTALAILGFYPYIVYLLGITYGKKQTWLHPLETYPPISIVMSAYNEEANVENRIKNLAECEYPDLEVIFVDDKSSDKTWELAQFYLDKYKFYYHLLGNSVRMGTSKSYNNAIRAATRDIIVITDADVTFKKNALHRIITRLMSEDNLGAVTGDLQPLPDDETTTSLEHQYRSVYGRMCGWESAWDSTFNFNGALIAFKKKSVIWINQTVGADDANIAFAAIHNGHRAVYEREAIVYEAIPASFKVQYRQKVRRAAGLIEAILANRDLMNVDRPFAKFFFLKVWMYLISPIALLSTAVLMIISSFLTSLTAGLIVTAALIIFFISTPFNTSFCLNQFYLLRGTIRVLSGTSSQTWESTASLQKVE